MKAVAIYARVSTEDQAKEGFSLDAQLEKMRAYCKIHDWKIVKEYVDEGQSGRTLKRKAYQRMMVEMDSWDTLLVLKMDRIHRSSRNFTTMMEELKRRNREFASVMESLDTATAMGRFVMDIIVRIAQLESETTGERVFTGMEQKAKQKGGGLGGPAPFGYRWEHGILQVEPEEAPIVRRIFALEGTPYGTIAKMLNAKGHRTRSGKPWTYWSVMTVHNNPVYRGHLKWGKTVQKNAHQPLVEA